MKTPSGRQCGNCGATVEQDAVTCPSCDALLAAYEAPAGSDTISEQASETAFNLVSTAEPTVTIETTARLEESRTPTPQRPDPAPFDADAALEDARRTLGMPVTPPSDPTPAREKDGVPADSLPEPAPIPTSMSAPRPKPESNTPSTPNPEREGTERSRPTLAERQERAQRRQPPLRPPTTDIDVPIEPPDIETALPLARIFQFGLFVVAAILVIRMSPFILSSGFGLIFVIIVLMNVMRFAAKSGGRKTTQMKQPFDQGPWDKHR